MFRSHETLSSEAMGRRMHLWRYGHFGVPMLVFPSAAGFAHEWDAHGMLDAIGDLITGGKVKLYCTESNVSEAWTRKENDPKWRMERHAAFERYVVDELVPFIREDCRSPDARIATAGCSLGASYAANAALKHPGVFNWALCMSGRYDMAHFTDGFVDAGVYFNSPLAYVPNLEGAELDKVRRNTHIVLVCGQGAWEEGCIEETQALGDLLALKQIPSRKDIWGRDVSHGWEWWRRQARFHLVQAFG